MLKWITDYIRYVENRPQDFNEHVKNNVRQIKELISRKEIFYKYHAKKSIAFFRTPPILTSRCR